MKNKTLNPVLDLAKGLINRSKSLDNTTFANLAGLANALRLDMDRSYDAKQHPEILNASKYFDLAAKALLNLSGTNR